MKFSFKYEDRISQYIFEDDVEKYVKHNTLINNNSIPDDDEIRIDLWKNSSELEKYKKIFSENQIFAELFYEELYCEVNVCKGLDEYPRKHLGRLSVVWEWLRGVSQDLPSADPDLMKYLGEIQYKRLSEIQSKIFKE